MRQPTKLSQVLRQATRSCRSRLHFRCTRSVPGRSLASRMEGLEKGHQCGGLRRVQVFPIRRHITAALEYLPHELIAGQPHSDRVKRRPSLAAVFTEGVAVVTLLRLEDKRPLDLKRRSSAY